MSQHMDVHSAASYALRTPSPPQSSKHAQGKNGLLNTKMLVVAGCHSNMKIDYCELYVQALKGKST